MYGLSSLTRRVASSCPVNLNHFRLLRVVGKGAFGKVRIVERKDTGLTFALKYIRKDEGELRSLRVGVGGPFSLKPFACSGEIGEREEHHPRTSHAGTTVPSVPMQSAI